MYFGRMLTQHNKGCEIPKALKWTLGISAVMAVVAIIMGLVWSPSIQLFAISFARRVGRAVDLAISANGTTLLGLIGNILVPLFFLLWAGRKGWQGMKDHWSQHVKTVFAVVGAWWFMVFLYQFILNPPEIFSTEEIESFAQGIVVCLASNDAASLPIGTGFWADEKGYIITSSNPREVDSVLDKSIFKIGVIVPPLLTGKILTVVAEYSTCQELPSIMTPKLGSR